jgi:hypothetical protein
MVLPLWGDFYHKGTRTQSFNFPFLLGFTYFSKSHKSSSIFSFSYGKRKISSGNSSPSPDSSGNPFAFFFKKQKIGTDSGK